MHARDRCATPGKPSVSSAKASSTSCRRAARCWRLWRITAEAARRQRCGASDGGRPMRRGICVSARARNEGRARARVATRGRAVCVWCATHALRGVRRAQGGAWLEPRQRWRRAQGAWAAPAFLGATTTTAALPSLLLPSCTRHPRPHAVSCSDGVRQVHARGRQADAARHAAADVHRRRGADLRAPRLQRLRQPAAAGAVLAGVPPPGVGDAEQDDQQQGHDGTRACVRRAACVADSPCPTHAHAPTCARASRARARARCAAQVLLAIEDKCPKCADAILGESEAAVTAVAGAPGAGA
jgi:hypothetical protein